MALWYVYETHSRILLTLGESPSTWSSRERAEDAAVLMQNAARPRPRHSRRERPENWLALPEMDDRVQMALLAQVA